MERPEFEALYGGAAGGGKSDALVMEALRQVDIPYYKGLILRKTFPQLRELIDKTLNYYPRIYPGVRYNSTSHTWIFPSGAKVIFGSLHTPQDKIQYQGQAYDFIGFDELTMFTYDEYMYLFSRCRPNGAGTRMYIRSTTNPGNIGHGWVKERFITAAPPMTPIPTETEWIAPDGTKHKATQKRIFVPSSVFDNDALMKNDPLYVQRLAMLPEAERNALLYGDWDTFTGQVFTEWVNDPKHYDDRIGTHVINPFLIPAHWTVWCGLDWGYSRPFAVGWYAVDERGRMYHIKEYYGYTGTPNTGVKYEPSKVAQEIKRIEEEDPNLKGRYIHRVGDPAIWMSDGTESIGALMERQGVYFEKGDHVRLAGLMQLHYRLQFDEDNIPMLYVFNTCHNFIRTVPNLVYDEKNVEDVDTDGEDHAYDQARYVCMANPIAARPPKVERIKPYNPLDDDPKPVEYGNYEWYRRY